ncbi:hybrid PKS-NRPS PsoA [Apodospora peruviana]|uniref:Hybrid PKS-NRPS PsoA n=1 Tax=Apodospora peruviana TaxID=516989 RepID=A0AAE0ILG8_9PEZI|nr:hybrid PKS-NRPS PsoA [Apodospora peruviana]
MSEPVAIVGTSCRFPGGSNSPSKLWELLKHPVDLSTEIPPGRFNAARFYHENAEHPGTTNVTKAYFLDHEPWAFDNEFFNISTREAESMDPQQRIILEIVYESIESAGYSISALRGSKTGVFVGQMSDDYRDLTLRDVDCHPQHVGTGFARSILANRVSYVFDWKGPSLNVDTACSSSLVALHLAVQSLRTGECDMAIVAGVNLVFSPELFSFLSSLRMLSPTGHSRMWDASADGYARGEGFASVVIKTLKKAVADGDDIESIIRNTAINQDGRSSGLTAPSAGAQAELIRSTYAACGLNCHKEKDRCQYFEAHGTGTQAGDPKEAEGLSLSFFPDHGDEDGGLSNGVAGGCERAKIQVGSIKTVVGHLEGAAGLASLLKASLAVQHGLIPPNLHFDRLNPDIKPYYQHLEVPTCLIHWPNLPKGTPRRASVNSFGFGGTNAHVIIESWASDRSAAPNVHSSVSCWGPFVLSAKSETALSAMIASLSTSLKSQNNVNMTRLAWTLQAHRTQFAYRVSFSANSKKELTTRLDSAIKDGGGQVSTGTKAAKVSEVRILGIFTGQGAQWATMGASLLRYSETFRRTMQQLQSILQSIPQGPTWSLTEQLLRQCNPEEALPAEISQPLCTALQIALVDLLKECGITFKAVIGHSSGEISAAYAAGVIGAADAMLIAYYRGYHSSRVQSVGGSPGKMMAVGMAPEDAEAFCRQPQFQGRVCVAAKNSPSSTTLSGDAVAIDEARAILDNKSVFARALKVDTAYHSHHMERVQGSYLASLKEVNIQPRRSSFVGRCNWYSSVRNYTEEKNTTVSVSDLLKDIYWVDNMTSPVLFSEAIMSAAQKEHFDLAIEIGPHPALRGPATESIRAVRGSPLPYQGVLERNQDALKTFANTLGFVWRNIDTLAQIVDFAGFWKACEGPEWTMPGVLKGLPSYPWDHNRPMLRESKRSKAWRTQKDQFHELLGHPNSDGNTREVRWRNILRLGDVEWLQGHRFQNQFLLPAAGYLAMAVGAALHLVGQDQSVQLIELQDAQILNGITLEESSPGVDLRFVIRTINDDPEVKTAEIFCHCSNVDAGPPEFDKEVFTCRVVVVLGPAAEDVLPVRIAPTLPMTDVSTDRFYTWMQKIGLEYSKPFVLDTIKRRANLATITTTHTVTAKYPIHPGTLDSIFQGLYAAFSYPGDGRLWTTYLPKSFRRVRFNMGACRQEIRDCLNSQIVADCYLTESSSHTMCGDIDAFSTGGAHEHPIIQIEGVVLSSLEIPMPANDRAMFWRTTWQQPVLSIVEPAGAETCLLTSSAEHLNLLHEVCERTAYFYLKQLLREVAQEEAATIESHFQYLLRWATDHVLPTAYSGQHPQWNPCWDADTVESITTLRETHSGQIDLELIHHLGPKLPSIVRGRSEPPLQLLMQEGMLESLYTNGIGVPETNGHLATLLNHLGHQYPAMNVLEIGAGTGGSTAVALQYLSRSNLGSYTFTDLSHSFFPAARTRFAEYGSHMRFQVLDIERSPVEQGFQAHSYDLIIAAHVLHATKSIAQTMLHCHRLLRPGGFLILLEPTNPKMLRIPFLFSSLPGWWLGREDHGRAHGGPTLTEAQWNVALTKNNLFSGVDQVRRDFPEDSMHALSVMMSQAVDDRINVLRNPLNLARGVAQIDQLLIIGGRTLIVSKIASQIQNLLGPFARHTRVVDRLEDVLLANGCLKYGKSAVVCLGGLEEATWARMNRQRLEAMQSLFREAQYVLWATQGCRGDDPYAGMMVGIARSVFRELAHLRLQLVDLDRIRLRRNQPDGDATLFSENLLRTICLDLPSYNHDILWSDETEIAVDGDGAVHIPRVIPDDDLNNSFNSGRRLITRSLCPVSNPIEISVSKGRGFVLDEAQIGAGSLQAVSSSLFRFACSDGSEPFYIVLGFPPNDNEQQLVTISSINGSAVPVTTSQPVFSCKGPTGTDKILLPALMRIIMCESFLEGSSTGTVWIHDADDYTAEVIYKMASEKGIAVFLTTSNPASALHARGRATYIHPRAKKHRVKCLIPSNITRFVSMGTKADVSAPQLAEYLVGREVGIRQGIHDISIDRTISLSYSRSKLARILERYCSDPDRLYDLVGHQQPPTTSLVKASLLHEQSPRASATSIISWTDVQSVQVRVAPPANTPGLLSGHKTYFLIGLTGDVGLSLCEWMVDHGAKYLVVASRNPVVPPEMHNHLERKGATVRIFTLDVADMEHLKTVHDEIVSSMPPIGGVANGALVVRDHPFDGMSLQDLEAVFRPKVIGSQNLDNLFFSTPLDFFILFSSVASIVGKPAQSSYNAANLFMSTLAIKRRKRGLAASVMHFGMLLGFGFIHGQAGPTVEARFRQDDLPAIPETEFHEIFAQTILSGRSQSGLNPEIIAGLGTEIDTPWRAMARFGHCRTKGSKDALDGELQQHHYRGQTNNQSIRDDLKGATDSQKAISVLKVAIAARLSLALGSQTSSEDSLDENVGLISLGLDSLVAVEIRSWLLKLLEVDVPVLKFLSGSSLKDICHHVLGQLPPFLMPWEKVHGKEGEINDDATGLDVLPPLESRDAPATNGIMNGITKQNSAYPPGQSLALDAVQGDQTPSNSLASGEPQENYERVGDMSHAQANLYFLQQYLQNNAYNVAYSGHFHGQLDTERLKGALWVVGKRHEAMRSAYFIDKSTSRPVQAVLSQPRIVVEHKTNVVNKYQIQTEIESVKDFRFDIEKGFVMKVTVLPQSPSLHFILFSHHHIALDGVAWSVFISEVAQAYSGWSSLGGGLTPAASDIRQSIDMARRQLSTYKPETLNASLSFWKDIFQTVPEPLPLFSFAKVKTFSRPHAVDYSINTADVKLPSELTRLVERAASKIGVTVFHFYLGSLVAFLSRCLGVDDVAIGVVDANRRDLADVKTVGYFLNMLPIRVRLEHCDHFDELARKSRDAVLAALDHANVPFDMILDELGISRWTSSGRHPLFQVAINYRRAPLNETDFGTHGKIQWDGPVVPGGNPYDLLLNVATTSDWSFISFITQKDLYRASDGALLLKWYTGALEALVRDPSVQVAKCQISSEADRVDGMQIGQGPRIQVPWKGTLVDRVDEVVAKLPNEIAIKDDGCQNPFTYAQMSNRTMLITRQLQTQLPTSLSPGSLHAAMLLDPVADAICCTLAILRLGLIWVPLDMKNHQQRIRAIIEESRPHILICHDETEKMARQICKDMSFVSITNIDHGYDNENKDWVPTLPRDRSREPAIILYTSGSTGVPKGVVLTHGGLMNQIYGTTTTLELGRETTLQQSPLGFDLMLDQIFLALCNGGTIVMVGKSKRGDPTQVAELIVRHGVTLTHFVPSEYLALLNYGHHVLKTASSWRYAMSGGEKLGWELRRAFRKLGCDGLELVNVYGPAEITLACARGIVPYRDMGDGLDSSSSSSDYLRPSPNYTLEITDADMAILPVGFPGEICISGVGVGLGYLDQTKESRQKFTQGRYRSGDKGRFLPDGTLEVLGRLDQDGQVKIHGFRVELDEIANAIAHAANGSIVNVAASFRQTQDPSSAILVAFVVFDVEFTGDKANLIRQVRSNLPLPPYMKPTFIIPTDRIPATANGKIDRAAVDQLSITDEPIDSCGIMDTLAEEGVLSPWEQSIKEAWEEVLTIRLAHFRKLNCDRQREMVIHSSTDFFQVGGNSILMIQLKSLLEIQFGVNVSMPELFHASTLRSMATLVKNALGAGASHRADSPSTEASSSFLRPRGGASQANIDWDLEIARMSDGLAQPKSIIHRAQAHSRMSKRKDGGRGLRVILTGATGFIGRHLLSRLVQDGRVAQVHCLAIRPEEATGKPRHVSVKSNKIVEYPGDLSSIGLGLSESQIKALTEQLPDVIIHNGADVSLLKTYQSLRRANVVSTRMLCDMAIPRLVPIHYVSTASVAKVVQQPKEDEGNPSPLLEVPASPATRDLLNSVDGYAASKWVSERLLERAAEDSGLPAYVHRLAHVVGDDASELDAIGMLIKYSLLLRALPRIKAEDVTGQWDFVMVEDVVEELVESAIGSAAIANNSNGMNSCQQQQSRSAIFVNHCSPVKTSHHELRQYLESMMSGGEPLEEISMKEWLAAACKRGLHPLVSEFYSAFDKEGRGITKMVLPVIAKSI